MWPMPGNGKCAAVTQTLAGGCIAEHLGAALDRLLAVDVKTDRHFRVFELHREVMHQIAHEQNALPLRGEAVRGAARRVPGLQLRIDHTRHGRLTGLERLEAPLGNIRRGGVLGDFEIRLGALGGLGDGLRIEPIISLCLCRVDRGIGEHRFLLCVDQPADMVQVQVSQQNRVDLGRLIPGGFHVVREHAGGCADALAGAGVHQNQLFAGVDQKRVERGLHARGFNRTAGQQRADLALGQALEQFRRQVVVTIEQRRHFVIAHRQAEVARHLCADLRRRLRRGNTGRQRYREPQRANQRMFHAFTFDRVKKAAMHNAAR